MIDLGRNYFDLFGLPARYRVDAGTLEGAYRALQSEVHPDRYAGASDAERRAAMQSSARVNEAYRALRDPVLRAEHILGLHGIEATSETDTALDFDFLERQLERREAAGEALEARDARAVSALIDGIAREAAEREAALAATLDDDRAYDAARGSVRELRFLKKLEADLRVLLDDLDD